MECNFEKWILENSKLYKVAFHTTCMEGYWVMQQGRPVTPLPDKSVTGGGGGDYLKLW